MVVIAYVVRMPTFVTIGQLNKVSLVKFCRLGNGKKSCHFFFFFRFKIDPLTCHFKSHFDKFLKDTIAMIYKRSFAVFTDDRVRHVLSAT